MDKKTKMWLGAGILGVGAYLLWKSKKAAAVSSAPANLVGFDSGSFYEPHTAKYGVGEGVFANQTGGMINSNEVVGGHAGVDNQGIFANQTGKRGSVFVGPLDQGTYGPFNDSTRGNRVFPTVYVPSDSTSKKMKFVSQDGTSFFDVQGGRQGIFANQTGASESFYDVRGGHAGVHGQGIFADATGVDTKNLGKLTNRKGFANQPFNFGGTMPFAAEIGDNEKFANAGGILDKAKAAWKANKYLPQWGTEATSTKFTGEVGDNEKFNATGGRTTPIHTMNAAGTGSKFFDVQTAKYGDNQGVFAAAEKMNASGKEGGLINVPSVRQAWVNR
jgi:hypothetical protein